MRIRRIAKMFFIVELINVNDVKENDYLKSVEQRAYDAIGLAYVQNFPFVKSDMSIYYDSETKRYTYTDMINKFVLETNVKIKLDNGKKEVVTLVTASKLRGVDEFEMRKHTKIK